ncbi:single-stranded DNA-binding protein [Paraflavisolibacter sp. H34]|uniref:single-stranded DNA-binding protein n=1 Tax=Huijunlia imazamoxiresistens TaxID=3127457 RepID=UPI0039C9F640
MVNTVNGKSVINFTVAHTEKYKDSQGMSQEKTTWVDCAYWTDRTAIAPYLTKGKQIFVEGAPEVRSFTRGDGTSGASLSLRVREVQLLGGRENALGGEPQQYQQPMAAPSRQQAAAPATTGPDVADDLPF